MDWDFMGIHHIPPFLAEYFLGHLDSKCFHSKSKVRE